MRHWDPNVWWLIVVVGARLIALDDEDKRQFYYSAMRTCQVAAETLGKLAIELERRYWEVAPYGG
jgi:hypothetical protein